MKTILILLALTGSALAETCSYGPDGYCLNDVDSYPPGISRQLRDMSTPPAKTCTTTCFDSRGYTICTTSCD